MYKTTKQKKNESVLFLLLSTSYNKGENGNMKTIIKRNWIFVPILFFFIIALLKKDVFLPMSVASYTDSWFELGEGETLEQSWISQVKEIAEIRINIKAENDFDGKMRMNILEGTSRNILSSTEEKFDFDSEMETSLIFHFSPFEVEAGKQYIIQINFNDEKKAGGNNKILVEAGSDYMGCTIDGIEKDGGAAFEIIYVKNSMFFWALISFFPFFSLSFLFMVLWNKKWEDTIGLSVAAGIFIMFFMGLLGYLEKGIFLLYVISIISAIVGVILYNYRKMNVKDLFSYGLCFFVVILVAILINCNGLRLARWDEFSHWGLAAKDMFYSDDFAKHAGSTVYLKSYPPVATLIEYFFCYTNRLYSDHMVYVGFQFLGISLLSVGFSVVKEKKQIIPTALILIFLPVIFFYDVSNSIYADPLLAFAVAYILICYYNDEKTVFDLVRICMGLFILTLTKDTGVVLAGVLTLIMLGDVVYKQWLEKKFNWKQIILPICGTAWICMLFFIWQGYLRVPVEITGQSAGASVGVAGAIDNSRISVTGIIDLFRGEDGGYRYQVIKNFITRIFSEEAFDFDILKFSFIDISIIMLVIAFVIGYREKKEAMRKKFISFSILTFVAGMGYCCFLLVTYLFAFSKEEALLGASFGRYSGSWSCGVLIALCIMIISYTYKEKYNYVLYIILSSIILVVTPVENLIFYNMDTQVTDDMTYGMDDLADIVRSGAKETDKVFFICNNSDGHARLQFRNALVPVLTQNEIFNIYDSKESYKRQRELDTMKNVEERGNAQFVDYKELKEEILKTDYVVILHANEAFINSYGSFFEKGKMVEDGTVYKVNKEKEEGFLEYIGKTGIKEFR